MSMYIDVDDIIEKVSRHSHSSYLNGSAEKVDRELVNGISFALEIDYNHVYSMVENKVNELLESGCCGGGCHG